MYMYLRKVSRKRFKKKLVFLLASLSSMTKIAGSGSESGSISQRESNVPTSAAQLYEVKKVHNLPHTVRYLYIRKMETEQQVLHSYSNSKGHREGTWLKSTGT
jgi:phage-related protein